MGNAESNVTSGIKKQAEASSCELYTLMDLKGNNAQFISIYISFQFH